MTAVTVDTPRPGVTLLAELEADELTDLVAGYGAVLLHVPARAPIPGSYWGDAEAGLVGGRIYVRADTPVHSVLHELCHYICMDAERRERLATDAGGTDDEECGVCYLQVALAARLGGYGRERCLDDIDAWGYSFREGSVRAWLAGDASFARRWLLAHGLIDAEDRPTLRLRA
jgi:hypothetical protein